VQERDRIMMAMLRSLGIEKGKPFQPDARMQKLLTEATLVGEAMAKVNDYEKRDMPLAHYADGSQWELALCLDPSQETENYTQLDERAAWFHEATATSNGMVTKTPASALSISAASKTRTATGSTVRTAIGCTFRPTRPQSNSGRSRSTTCLPARSSRTTPRLRTVPRGRTW